SHPLFSTNLTKRGLPVRPCNRLVSFDRTAVYKPDNYALVFGTSPRIPAIYNAVNFLALSNHE
ncbi:hypothetical protein OGM63_21630, partial [Plectonema radiosum NIES-515]